MAVRFDTAGELLSRTTTLPGITSFTLMTWAYWSGGVIVDDGAVSLGSANGASFYMVGLNTSTMRVRVYNGSASTDGTTAIATGTWYHLALTVAGTGAGQCLTYLNGVQEISVSGTAGNTAAKLYVGNSDGGDLFNGRITAVKVYSAVLTADEIKQEMRSIQPVRTANLNTWSPLLTHTDVGNYAGTGAWTVGGTLSTEDGPPVAWSLRPSMPRRPAAVAAAGGARQTAWVIGQAVPRASAF